MADIDHTRDCVLPSDGKAEGLVRASELFAVAAERDALCAEIERLRAALEPFACDCEGKAICLGNCMHRNARAALEGRT